MEEEIKKPVIERPDFPKVPYDYRNMEKAGHFRGVGYGDYVGKFGSSMDCYAMPKDATKMKVPRDHEG